MPFHPKDNGLGNSRNQTNKIAGLQDLTPPSNCNGFEYAAANFSKNACIDKLEKLIQ